MGSPSRSHASKENTHETKGQKCVCSGEGIKSALPGVLDLVVRPEIFRISVPRVQHFEPGSRVELAHQPPGLSFRIRYLLWLWNPGDVRRPGDHEWDVLGLGFRRVEGGGQDRGPRVAWSLGRCPRSEHKTRISVRRKLQQRREATRMVSAPSCQDFSYLVVCGGIRTRSRWTAHGSAALFPQQPEQGTNCDLISPCFGYLSYVKVSVPRFL
mmetsp:Transcript_11262/g.26467  ORF Transcript_11262/g.26467 Transcript_11262/m.26467 type:complete len:212 (+) Transcript_11262:1483-2118(+)